MKTKKLNGIKVKNIEFSEGEMLFDMDKETATHYRNETERLDLENAVRLGNRMAERKAKNVIKNINNYINNIK